MSGPYEVIEIEGHCKARHFDLTKEQWDKLRHDRFAHCGGYHMSLFTFKNMKVDVEDILNSIQIV